MRESRPLFAVVQELNMSLTAHHIAGALNAVADLASRTRQVLSTEWRLSTGVFRWIMKQSVWGMPSVDPLRKQAKFSAPKICFALSKFISSGGGRASLREATISDVCVSAQGTAGMFDAPHETATEPPPAASSPLVPGSQLVPFAALVDGDGTEINPGDGGPAKSATLASPAREPGSTGAPRVAGADAYARQKGYSQKVLKHMSKARAGTTSAELEPTQVITFLGFSFDLVQGLIFPLPEKLDNVEMQHAACSRADGTL